MEIYGKPGKRSSDKAIRPSNSGTKSVQQGRQQFKYLILYNISQEVKQDISFDSQNIE
jgi:hypothetical protein